MTGLLEKLDSRTILTLVTSVGGLLLAFFAFRAYTTTVDTHIDIGFGEIKAAVTESQRQDSDIKERLIRAIEQNTAAVGAITRVIK